MTHSDTPRPHMSPLECADYLGCSVDWLNASRCRGDGPPFYKLGRLVKYIPDVVDEWARKRLVNSTSERIGNVAEPQAAEPEPSGLALTTVAEPAPMVR